MDDLDLLAPDQRLDLAAGFQAEHCPQRQQQFGRKAALIVAALIGHNPVAVRFKHRAVGGKDGVLTAGQPVPAVHEQHGRPRFTPRAVHTHRPAGPR